MVSTRSHDGEVKGMDIVAKAESDPSHARSRKRKFGDVGEDLAKQSTIKPPKEKAMTATVSVEGQNPLPQRAPSNPLSLEQFPYKDITIVTEPWLNSIKQGATYSQNINDLEAKTWTWIPS